MTDLMVASVRGDRRGVASAVVWRVWQFVHLMVARRDERVDGTLRRLLGDDRQFALLTRLPPFDRAHHLRVYELLREYGCDDDDVLRAGLLHDVGKADGVARVRVGHRVAKVLLSRLAPDWLNVKTEANRGRFWHAMYLACHHARVGAEFAGQCGVSSRCCALIACHDNPSVARCDPALALLMRADAAAIR